MASCTFSLGLKSAECLCSAILAVGGIEKRCTFGGRVRTRVEVGCVHLGVGRQWLGTIKKITEWDIRLGSISAPLFGD